MVELIKYHDDLSYVVTNMILRIQLNCLTFCCLTCFSEMKQATSLFIVKNFPVPVQSNYGLLQSCKGVLSTWCSRAAWKNRSQRRRWLTRFTRLLNSYSISKTIFVKVNYFKGMDGREGKPGPRGPKGEVGYPGNSGLDGRGELQNVSLGFTHSNYSINIQYS